METKPDLNWPGNYTFKFLLFGDVLTKDLDMDNMLSFAVAVFSHQLVVALVLSDGVWDGNLSVYSRPVHLKMRMQNTNESYTRQFQCTLQTSKL